MAERKDAPPTGGRKDQKARTDGKRRNDAATPGQQPKGRDQKRPGSRSNPG
jgi:hypothetical protein